MARTMVEKDAAGKAKTGADKGFPIEVKLEVGW